MSYFPDKPGILSTANSTTSPLTASQIYTGTYEDVLNYSVITINLGAGSPSNCSGSLYYEFSQDGIITDRSIIIPVSDISNPTPGIHTFIPIAKYGRVKYVNGTIVQTAFRLQTIYHKYLSKIPTTRASQETNQYNDLENVRALLSGEDESGNIRNISATSEGHIETSIHSPITAYGDVLVGSNTPAVQLDFVYGYNPDMVITSSFVNGNITFANNLATVATSTDNGSYASLNSRRFVRYRSGQGASSIWSGIYSTPVVSSSQIIGPFSSTAGFGFGYNGTSFGILHRTNGVLEVRHLSVSVGTGVSSEVATINLDSKAYSVPLSSGLSALGVANALANFNYKQELTSSNFNGHGCAWNAFSSGSNIIFSSFQAINHTGSFNITSTGTATGSFTKIVSGVEPTDTWITKSSWNIDICDGSGGVNNPSGLNLNALKGNVYRIDWQYLGFGNITFFVENPNSGEFTQVHKIRYPNSYTSTSLITPSAHMNLEVKSLGSTSIISASVGSFSGFTQGIVKRLGPKKSFVNSKNSVGATLTNIFSLKNGHLFKNKNNFCDILFSLGSAACDGTKSVQFYLITNPVLGGTPNWIPIDTNTSCILYDTAGTTVTGGSIKHSFTLGKTSNMIINMLDLESILIPGEMATFAAKTDSGTSDVDISISWIEEQ